MKTGNHNNETAVARRADLVVQEVKDEVLIYDLKQHKATCLNQSAAFVWKHCDGKTTVSEMAALLGQEFETPVGDEIVWYALDRLSRADLIEGTLTPPGNVSLSRRRMMKGLGIGAMLAIPAVISLVAPTAAQAATVVFTSKKVANGTCESPPGPHPNPACFNDTCCTGTSKLCSGNSSLSACTGTPCQPLGSSSDCNA